MMSTVNKIKAGAKRKQSTTSFQAKKKARDEPVNIFDVDKNNKYLYAKSVDSILENAFDMYYNDSSPKDIVDSTTVSTANIVFPLKPFEWSNIKYEIGTRTVQFDYKISNCTLVEYHG